MDVEFSFIVLPWVLAPHQEDGLHIVSPILWVPLHSLPLCG